LAITPKRLKLQPFVCIDLQPAARSYPGFPKSVDEEDMDGLRARAIRIREWLAENNQKDRRVVIERWEAQPDGTDKTVWRIQWDGESGDTSAYARDAYFDAEKMGELHTMRPVIAALMGCTEAALDSLYAQRMTLPSGKVIQTCTPFEF
jgi:hypothetical protein